MRLRQACMLRREKNSGPCSLLPGEMRIYRMPRDNSTMDWQPSQRYPDPSIVVVDEAFNKYRMPLTKVERLYTGCRWAEGPVWLGDTRSLVWSDIPNNRMLRWDEETGKVSVFRKPSGYANGNTRDRKGRILTCEHGGRRVSRTEQD